MLLECFDVCVCVCVWLAKIWWHRVLSLLPRDCSSPRCTLTTNHSFWGVADCLRRATYPRKYNLWGARYLATFFKAREFRALLLPSSAVPFPSAPNVQNRILRWRKTAIHYCGTCHKIEYKSGLRNSEFSALAKFSHFRQSECCSCRHRVSARCK